MGFLWYKTLLMKKQVKILKADLIPYDKIQDGDIRSFQEKTAQALIKKGIAEEGVEKPKRKPRAKKAE